LISFPSIFFFCFFLIKKRMKHTSLGPRVEGGGGEEILPGGGGSRREETGVFCDIINH
jgi:hypothetical protein